MPRPKPTRPTDFELEILAILWESGGATVRDVHEPLRSQKPELGRTTVSKIMDVMIVKGLIEVSSEIRPAIYKSIVDRKSTERNLVKDLMKRVFKNSPSRLLAHALAGKKPSADEMAKLKELLASA